MKRLLAIALTLSVASCDNSTMTADGTSSETQSSLQALATRLDGIRAGKTPAATFAARMAASDGDSSGFEEMWGIGSQVRYTKELGKFRLFRMSLDTSERLSSDTYRSSFRYALADGWMRYSSGTVAHGRACPDSSGTGSITKMPPDCAEATGNAADGTWMRYEFRNGAVLTTSRGAGDQSPESFVVDGRWTIIPNVGIEDDGDRWWDVYENGRRIGSARQKGHSWVSDDDQDGYMVTVSTMTVYDLEGRIVSPDSSLPVVRIAFPEDSLGLSIDSASIDSSNRRLRIALSWRFMSGPEVPIGTPSMLDVTSRDLTCWGVAPECYFAYETVFVIGSLDGTGFLDVPLDDFAVAHPAVLTVGIRDDKDSLVGMRSRKTRHFEASAEVAFPSSTKP